MGYSYIIGNAVVHRDYANSGRDSKVAVYDDMVNIVSPGGLPSTLTQYDILEGRSEIRNKVIARVFKELNYIEQWGTGIKRIISSCTGYGLREPEIQEKGDFIDVRLYREAVYTHQQNLDTSLTVQESAIMDYLKNNENRITTETAKSLLGIENRRARDILRGLIEKQVIERAGKGPGTYYTAK
jgi:ATP-dependent DNA helicase RecG